MWADLTSPLRCWSISSDGKLSFQEFTDQVAATDIARQLTLDVSHSSSRRRRKRRT